jgi:hypothetical protein
MSSMNNMIFLFLIIVIGITLPFIYNNFYNITENFTDSLGTSSLGSGNFPSSEINTLIQDSYPSTGNNGVSTQSSSKMWWHYPIFKVGSFDQITNNFKYPNNPDIGNCTPSEFCGALYKTKHLKSNHIKPLLPVNDSCGVRVGYFSTDKDIY